MRFTRQAKCPHIDVTVERRVMSMIRNGFEYEGYRNYSQYK